MPQWPLTILFMPESAYGPTNNCIGIGDVLRRRGHRVVFAAEASWQDRLEPLGFAEDLVNLAPPLTESTKSEVSTTAGSAVSTEDDAADAGQFWKAFIRDTAPEFRKPTIEQLAKLGRGIADEVLPELPGVGGVILSADRAARRGADLAFAADRAGWQDFRDEYERVHRPLWEDFNVWVTKQGAPSLPSLEFIHEGTVNLYVYPELADYRRARPLGPSWHRLDSSVRKTEGAFALPDQLAGGGGALIYFSLGSLGSADVALMRRVIDCLAATPHRYIVSKGPLAAEIDLPSNMWGAEFVPQTAVIPLCDLVISHGGNNTTTECLHFGKPMIVLPLFWDQYDNAQRVHELGLGVRLDTYGFGDADMHAALDRLLGDTALYARLAGAAAAIQRRDGVGRAARLIEAAAGG